MIDHIGLNVRDVARATEFYLKALGPARLRHRHAGLGGGDGRRRRGRLRRRAEALILDRRGRAQSGPMHVAFVAPSRAAVDAFYAAAIKAGGKDNGGAGSAARIITPIITEPSSSIPTATMPRPSAICLRKSRNSALSARNSAARRCKARAASRRPSRRSWGPSSSHRG